MFYLNLNKENVMCEFKNSALLGAAEGSWRANRKEHPFRTRLRGLRLEGFFTHTRLLLAMPFYLRSAFTMGLSTYAPGKDSPVWEPKFLPCTAETRRVCSHSRFEGDILGTVLFLGACTARLPAPAIIFVFSLLPTTQHLKIFKTHLHGATLTQH